jgi:hypothetical protein
MTWRRLITWSVGGAVGLLVAAGAVHADHPGGAVRAAGPSAFADASSLTGRLRDLHARLRRADATARSQALADLVATARARERRLAALMEESPADVLQAALSASERSLFPPEVRVHLEEEASEEGDVEVLHEDRPDGGRYLYTLRTDRGPLAVHFARVLPDLMTGDLVRVRGVRLGRAMAADGGAAGVTLVSAALSNTVGAQSTIVIVVNFSNSTAFSAASVSQIEAVTFGSGSSVTNYYREASYGETWLTGTAVGPFTIAMSNTGCDYYGIASQARSAATGAGVNLSNYRRYVYVFPSNGCGWSGLGTVGGSPSQAWIRGGYHYGVVIHELGHNHGLYHSHAYECGSVVVGSGCSSIEYGDTLDAMGYASPPYHFNAIQKERLGWLNYSGMPPITTVQASGVYTIDPYETDGANPKAVKLRAPNGDWYYVEYRQPIGFDAPMPLNVRSGVVVHLWKGMSADGVYLLDMTPSTSTWMDPALQVNSTFADPAAGITVTPVWANATNAGVSISVGGDATCVRASPAISVSPAVKSGAAGSKLAYSVSITNRDQNCAATTFSGGATRPSGWSAAFTAPSLTIAPGATAVTTLEVTSAGSAAPGGYQIGITASGASSAAYSGSTTATYDVTSSAGGTGGSFTDGFDRPDAPSLGSAWSAVSGSLAVQDGQARIGAAAAGFHTAVVSGLTGAAQSAGARFAVADTNSGPRFGVLLLHQDAKNYYACYRRTGGTSDLRIVRVVNGVERVLGRAAIANPKKGSTFALGCSVQGGTLTLTLDGAARATASDATFSSGGVGLLMGYAKKPSAPKANGAEDFTAQAH